MFKCKRYQTPLFSWKTLQLVIFSYLTVLTYSSTYLFSLVQLFKLKISNISVLAVCVYNFLLWQMNFLLSPNTRCGWTELTNRTMRRAFGPSESHAFYLFLSPPFCTKGWASSLCRSCQIWMCASFIFHTSYFCFVREFVILCWCCDSVILLLWLFRFCHD